VLVPVAVVGGVAMAVVDVIGVITVLHRLVPTALAMGVQVVVMGHVDVGRALVPMLIVIAMSMAIVEIVGMVTVYNSDVTAAHAMDVRMIVVCLVGIGWNSRHC
jgi:hypothetical protein